MPPGDYYRQWLGHYVVLEANHGTVLSNGTREPIGLLKVTVNDEVIPSYLDLEAKLFIC
jgi:hypothetical protein